jgi:glycosyltransferase involved in cell wall biosynthesis
MNRLGLREFVARTRANGLADSSRRAVRRVYGTLNARMDLRSLDFPLEERDIASSATVTTPPATVRGGTLNIAWLCTPPGFGSGGHTTFFRMLRGMEERGHRCTILLYNRHGGDLERHQEVIRPCWPELAADIREVPGRLAGFDACVASSWDTAHVLATRTPRGARLNSFYFIQDYEPYFYPRGSLYALAEDSYRFGFTHLALGPMVTGALRREAGVDAVTISFGSDLSNYSCTNTGTRCGVAFFARPGVDRRGYELGRLALKEFHRLHPEQEIHIYGERVRGWGIPVVQHGMLNSAGLNSLYNQTAAGLALSFTNITLIAAEMLSAGNIAILNDHEFSRQILTNPEAVWAAPNPSSLATALSKVVTDSALASRSSRAAAYSGPSWAQAQAEVAQSITGQS